MKAVDRRPLVYLEDIRRAIERIELYTVRGRKAFLSSELTQDGVLRLFGIIGEAASKLPARLKDLRPEIPWTSIVGLRNVLIHEYSGVRIERIWETVKRDLPPLRQAVDALFASEQKRGAA